jgi:hypothetical protein
LIFDARFACGSFRATVWQATAPSGISVGLGSQLGSNNADATLTMSFASGDVCAVGGNLFLADVNFGFLLGLAQVERSDGSASIVNIQRAKAMSGFMSPGSAISQITISPFGVQPNAYVKGTHCLWEWRRAP